VFFCCVSSTGADQIQLTCRFSNIFSFGRTCFCARACKERKEQKQNRFANTHKPYVS
jgi:hypothetical protein